MHKILSVDDEPINQVIVEELLSSRFQVALVSSGEECLNQIEDIKPDLILLDVSMPGIDGYQTCRKIKATESTRHIPIIFVSARSTLEDKIKGYEAGGYDYISKPFNHSELEVKIEQLIKAVKQSMASIEHRSQQTLKSATSTTHISGNSAIIKQFLDVSFSCHSLDELAKLLLNTSKQLQLNCVFQFRNGANIYNFSTPDELSPLELSLIEQTQELGRFFDFNPRMIVTLPHLSLLVKNMPKDDDKCYGDIKVLLETLLSGVESKLKALFDETKPT